MKTAKITLEAIKSSDGWEELATKLGLSEAVKKAHFEFGEFASIEIEVNEKLFIVGGRIFPLKR